MLLFAKSHRESTSTEGGKFEKKILLLAKPFFNSHLVLFKIFVTGKASFTENPSLMEKKFRKFYFLPDKCHFLLNFVENPCLI